MNIKHLRLAVLALVPLGVAACERDRAAGERPGTVTTPAVPTDERQPVRGTVSSAVQEIVQARCAREMKCNNVGEGREYASEQACMTRIQAEWRDELNARECPGGINRDELNECLQEIRNNDCSNPFDTLGRITACRESDICEAVR